MNPSDLHLYEFSGHGCGLTIVTYEPIQAGQQRAAVAAASMGGRTWMAVDVNAPMPLWVQQLRSDWRTGQWRPESMEHYQGAEIYEHDYDADIWMQSWGGFDSWDRATLAAASEHIH